MSKLAKKKQISTVRISVTLDSIRLALVDDTGLYHQQLISLSLDTISATLQMENGTEDAKSFILRRMGIYEFPFMKGDFKLNAVAKYYNYESGADEPLIESWGLKASIKKVLPNGFDKEGMISIGNPKLLN